ncbi:prenyltransferase [Cellulomonas chitinilytica]|uniref:Prenyltransferase n=1 Tax=Cellulomonas chitinilytica TaxID=398759 RepID=A0A919P2H5_9CELL|nr:prenyltransferase [Cellulomonas chitinilytica]GIG20461.1 prenyltransferase [Cellulomonas chitinilytica]
MTTATTARPGPLAGLGQVLLASRPLSWINTAYPFAVAYLLAGGEPGWLLAVGTLYFLVPYNLLMYGLNDVFDYASDLANPRKGGIEGAVLDDRWHRATLWSAVASNVPFLVVLLAAGGLASGAVLAVSVFAVVAYSAPGLRFKERPFLDSVTSSTHFVSPAVLGIALAGGRFTAPVVATLAAFFLWGAASHAFGAVQDITADRGAGIASIATALGARRTVRLAMGGYAVSAVLMLTAGPPAALAAVVPLPYLASVAPYRHLDDTDCEQAHRGWRRFLWLNLATGFLLTQALIVAALRT